MDEVFVGKVIKEIYVSALGCKEGEKTLVFTDELWLREDGANKTIFNIFKEVAKDLGLKVSSFVYKERERHGAEPPRELWEKIFGKNFLANFNFGEIEGKRILLNILLEFKDHIDYSFLPDVVFALPYYSTTHTLFRKFLNELGARYVSMPRIEERMFYNSLNVDFRELEEDTLQLLKSVEGKNAVFITADNGTELFMEFKGRSFLADTGNLRERGSFGNLPAGEVFIAPLEDKTNGKVVLEYGLGKKLEVPLTLHIEGGKVKAMEGDRGLKEYLERLFDTNPNNSVLAELGIGTNKKANDVFNVLEAEKIYNTCHIALGDNSTFGGVNVASAHLDFVIFNPILRWDSV